MFTVFPATPLAFAQNSVAKGHLDREALRSPRIARPFIRIHFSFICL